MDENVFINKDEDVSKIFIEVLKVIEIQIKYKINNIKLKNLCL